MDNFLVSLSLIQFLLFADFSAWPYPASDLAPGEPSLTIDWKCSYKRFVFLIFKHDLDFLQVTWKDINLANLSKKENVQTQTWWM